VGKEELKKFETEIGTGRKIERVEQEEEVEYIEFRFRIVLLDRAQLNINHALARGNNGFVCSQRRYGVVVSILLCRTSCLLKTKTACDTP